MQSKTSKTDQTNPQPTASPRSGLNETFLKVAGAVVVVLLVVLAIGLLNRSNSQANSNVPKASQSQNLPLQNAEVDLTGSGFSPSTISVRANTQITWVNKDTSPHRVAADPYPKDNSIPGFDNNEELQPNGSYSFTFTKSGIYHVHDEANPLKSTATIVVN